MSNGEWVALLEKQGREIHQRNPTVDTLNFLINLNVDRNPAKGLSGRLLRLPRY